MQRFVRVAFFLWVSVVNLVGLSTMWARMADVFGSEAGTRLFGFLGAGATCGMHQPPQPFSTSESSDDSHEYVAAAAAAGSPFLKKLWQKLWIITFWST